MTIQQKASKISKRRWAGKALLCPGFILSLALGFAFSPQSARAEQPHYMVYEVYAGGIHAVQSKLMINFGKNNRYDIEMQAATRGLLGSLAPWSGTFESHGWVEKDGTYKPEQHRSSAIWKGDEEIKDYQYNRNGTFKGLTITEDGKPPKKEKVEAELTDHTVDTLTAALEVMKKVSDGGACEGSSEVFDGSRRFEQVFASQGTEELEPTRYNIYGGPAEVCTVEVVPIAGKWHEKPRGWMSIQEQGRARGTMPTVWMGKMGKEGPVVPVKVRVKTAYGALFMHLAEYRNGDEFLVAEKRVTEEE